MLMSVCVGAGSVEGAAYIALVLCGGDDLRDLLRNDVRGQRAEERRVGDKEGREAAERGEVDVAGGVFLEFVSGAERADAVVGERSGGGMCTHGERVKCARGDPMSTTTPWSTMGL